MGFFHKGLPPKIPIAPPVIVTSPPGNRTSTASGGTGGSTTFVDNHFEVGGTLAQTLSPLGGDATHTSVVTSPVVSPTHALQFNEGAGGGTAYVTYEWGNNAALLTNRPYGIYVRWRVALDQTMLDNAVVGTGGQVKLFGARYLNNGAGQPGGFILGIGNSPDASSVKGEVTCIADQFGVVLPDSASGVIMTALQYETFQVWLSRDASTNTGYGKCWHLNTGTGLWDLKTNLTHVDNGTYAFLKNADVASTDDLFYMIGNVFSNVAGNVYIDDVKIADFFIAD